MRKDEAGREYYTDDELAAMSDEVYHALAENRREELLTRIKDADSESIHDLFNYTFIPSADFLD